MNLTFQQNGLSGMGVIPVALIAPVATQGIKILKSVLSSNGAEYPGKIYVNQQGQRVLQVIRRNSGTTVELPYEGPSGFIHNIKPARFSFVLGMLITRAIDAGDYADLNRFTIEDVIAADKKDTPSKGQIKFSGEAEQRQVLDPSILPYVSQWKSWQDKYAPQPIPAPAAAVDTVQQAAASLLPDSRTGWIIGGTLLVLLAGGYLFYKMD